MGRRSHTFLPSLFSAVVDADLDYSGKGMCFFHAGAKLEEVRVGDLCSSTLNYNLYCSPGFKNPSPGHRPPLVTPPPAPPESCIPVPITSKLDPRASTFLPTPAAPATLDTLAPVFSLEHSPSPVPLFGPPPQAPSPIFLSLSSPRPTPLTSLLPPLAPPTANPGPAVTLIALDSSGPSRQVASPQ